jgi:preprotein translocase SecE subunit
MYKWPQGRIIRTICLIVALIVAVDLGYNGAYARLSVYAEEGTGWRQLMIGSIYAAAALAALISGLVLAGLKPATVDFLIEVEQEMTRVTWPKPNELVQRTLWIAVMIVVLAGGIFAVDLINKSFLDYIFGVNS